MNDFRAALPYLHACIPGPGLLNKLLSRAIVTLECVHVTYASCDRSIYTRVHAFIAHYAWGIKNNFLFRSKQEQSEILFQLLYWTQHKIATDFWPENCPAF